jgi:enterochelin esterase-like enzyme
MCPRVTTYLALSTPRGETATSRWGCGIWVGAGATSLADNILPIARRTYLICAEPFGAVVAGASTGAADITAAIRASTRAATLATDLATTGGSSA